MEEIRTEGYERQPIIPSSLFQVFLGSSMSSQEEGNLRYTLESFVFALNFPEKLTLILYIIY